MNENSLGLELMDLYRQLRQTTDPAVKEVIRRRIDSKLARRETGGLAPAAEALDGEESSAD